MCHCILFVSLTVFIYAAAADSMGAIIAQGRDHFQGYLPSPLYRPDGRDRPRDGLPWHAEGVTDASEGGLPHGRGYG